MASLPAAQPLSQTWQDSERQSYGGTHSNRANLAVIVPLTRGGMPGQQQTCEVST